MLVSTRAAFCSAGSGCQPFPDVFAPIRPSDSSPSSAAALVVPRCAAHLGSGASSVPAEGAPSTLDASEILVRLPVGLFFFPEEGRGLPGYWVVLLLRAVVRDPAEHAVSLALLSVTALLPSESTSPWALGNQSFRGCTHTARILAYLRIIR
jgi:hypothetical protein